MNKPSDRRVALDINPSSGYFRAVCRGIRAFSPPAGEWFFPVQSFTDRWREDIPVWKPHGLIIQLFSRAQYDFIRTLGVPFVNVSNTFYDPAAAVPLVTQDDQAVGRLAADYFLSRGFRSFGFFGEPGARYSDERQAAFAGATQGHRCSVFHHAPPDHAGRREQALIGWIESLPLPVAIFAANDFFARQVIEAARHAGRRVPEDLAALGADNDELETALVRPALSSISLPAERIGYEAAVMLDALMSGKTDVNCNVRLPPIEVVTRQSSDIRAIDDPVLARALAFISEHSAEGINVDNVLAAVGVSRTGLEVRFASALGRSPLAEIQRVRMDRVKHLLSTTDLPLDEVSLRTGYAKTERLCRAFKRLTGLTTTAYRRQFRLRSA